MEYLTVEEVIEINKIVLREIRVRKADQPRVLADWKLEEGLELVKKTQGDIYDKAVAVVTELARGHAFASGNRRTAYVTAKVFLERNGAKMRVKHDPNVLQGIREGFYSKKEIKEWLKGNAIKEFLRGQS